MVDKSEEQLFLDEGTDDEAVTEETPATDAEPVAEAQVEGGDKETEPEPEPDPKPTEDEQQPEPEPVAAKEKEVAQVPSWRLREVNEAKQAAEKQAQDAQAQLIALQQQMAAMQQQFQQQQQPQPQQVDPNLIFENPEAWQAHQQQERQQELRALRMELAETRAISRYGEDVVQSAIEAAQKAELSDPMVTQRIAGAANPWVEAVNWHKEIQTREQLGEGGIDGFRQREREALMQDPEFQAQVIELMRSKAGGQPSSKPAPIPNLNGAPRAGNTPAADQTRPMTDNELFLSE